MSFEYILGVLVVITLLTLALCILFMFVTDFNKKNLGFAIIACLVANQLVWFAKILNKEDPEKTKNVPAVPV